MPVRIRFTGAATNNATLTISWAGGYPPGATASAVETFKFTRSTFFQTQIGLTATTQAANFLYAITTDYGANFLATQINNDVIVTPKNGTTSITATTTSANIQINPTVQTVQLINRPQDITPVYNPVIFKFFSVNYSNPGFRYLIDVYNTRDSSKIGSFKVLPVNDGSGYIDISKPLSNLVSVDFKNSGPVAESDQINSYIPYEVQLSEEYQFNWPFNTITQYGGTGPYSSRTRLNNSLATAHSYTVGDQINISTYPTGTSGTLTGLHRVVATPTSTSIVVDVTYPGATAAGASGGVTSFADGRKTTFPVDAIHSGIALNGACTFQNLINFDGVSYLISPDTDERRVFSSILDKTSDTFGNEEWWMNNSQIMDINVLIDGAGGEYVCKWLYLNKAGTPIISGSIYIKTGETLGMGQFRIGFPQTIGFLPYSTGYALQFWIEEDASSTQVSRNYFVYHDKRCQIEDYTIAFMDRFGSIMSYSFPLRAKESGKIKRDTYTKAIDYQQSSGSYANIYPTTAAGDTTYSVNLEKELELNTNWMSDFMSESFEELLTSPYTWIKMPDNNYYACTVQETGFETERQKNKRLIRKTVKVKLANENVINI